jgi:hypothetical protein
MDEWEQEDIQRAQEAEAYVRRYGNRGLRFISDMWDRLTSGKQLTEVQVERVLISREAEIRSSQSAAKRISKQESQAAKQLDLNQVLIGDDVADGNYAIETPEGIVLLRIKREQKGGFRGFLFVEHVVGEDTERYGVQYPQPARIEKPQHRQFYRGHFAHLVAQLVADPLGAKALYDSLEDAV